MHNNIFCIHPAVFEFLQCPHEGRCELVRKKIPKTPGKLIKCTPDQNFKDQFEGVKKLHFAQLD